MGDAMTVTASEATHTDEFNVMPDQNSTDVLSKPSLAHTKPTILPPSSLDSLNSKTPSTRDSGSKRYNYDPARPISRRKDSKQFIPLARWEGTVLERYDSYFVAEVIDLNTDESATAEFDLAELTPGDVHLCEPGALFYWTIGYDVKEGGQRSRVSVLLFRRLGPIAKRV
ncbi:hypothetical protein [Streptomyces sp. NPDC059805]|uniref:hypothetical protein n=1 Tax=Streptomyces sp. NPDC059805 TaxID=3346954 RepID=UPI00365CD65A